MGSSYVLNLWPLGHSRLLRTMLAVNLWPCSQCISEAEVVLRESITLVLALHLVHVMLETVSRFYWTDTIYCD